MIIMEMLGDYRASGRGNDPPNFFRAARSHLLIIRPNLHSHSVNQTNITEKENED
jgi:hypothetical protein